MGSSKSDGVLTVAFESADIKKVNVYAAIWSSDKSTAKISTSSNYEGSVISLDSSKYNSDGFQQLTWTDIGTTTDLIITCTKRILVQKIEIVVASEESPIDTNDITNIKNSLTKAQLNYKYEFDESDSTYNISDIGMRFGGTIKESYYDAIKSHIKSFGMVYTTKDKLGDHETLTDALNTGVPEDTFTVKEETLTESAAPVAQTIDDETYYVWNVYLNVGSSSLDKTVYAVGKLTLDNSETYYLTEKSGSVESLANYYFDNELYADEIQMHTLYALATGDTKTESIKSSSSTDASSSSQE